MKWKLTDLYHEIWPAKANYYKTVLNHKIAKTTHSKLYLTCSHCVLGISPNLLLPTVHTVIKGKKEHYFNSRKPDTPTERPQRQFEELLNMKMIKTLAFINCLVCRHSHMFTGRTRCSETLLASSSVSRQGRLAWMLEQLIHLQIYCMKWEGHILRCTANRGQ